MLRFVYVYNINIDIWKGAHTMCLVIDSGILVANTYYYNRKPFIDYIEIRKYCDFLLKEMGSTPVLFSNDIDGSCFSVGKCEFIKTSNKVLVKSFDNDDYLTYLSEIFPQEIIDTMANAGNEYRLHIA